MLNKTVGEVVNEVVMLSTAKPGHSVLLVEGTDDVKFWKPRVVTACYVVYATGKKTAKSAVDKLNVLRCKCHVGVFDRDYDDIGEATNIGRNRIFWDAHSLETVLFLSPSGDKVLNELFDPEEIARIERQFGLPIKELIIASCEQFGRVRLLHHQRSGAIDVEATSLFRVYVTGDGHGLREDRLHAEATRCGAVPSIAQAARQINSVDGWEARLLIRGHDIGILIHIYAREFGNSCSMAMAEGALRLAFERADLEQTSVYFDLLQWEAARPPFKIISRADAIN
jgi:hypothetical protein